MLQLMYCFQDPVAPSNERRSCPLPETPCWGYFVIRMICYDGYFPDNRPSIRDLARLARPEELNERLPLARSHEAGVRGSPVEWRTFDCQQPLVPTDLFVVIAVAIIVIAD